MESIFFNIKYINNFRKNAKECHWLTTETVYVLSCVSKKLCRVVEVFIHLQNKRFQQNRLEFNISNIICFEILQNSRGKKFTYLFILFTYLFTYLFSFTIFIPKSCFMIKFAP